MTGRTAMSSIVRAIRRSLTSSQMTTRSVAANSRAKNATDAVEDGRLPGSLRSRAIWVSELSNPVMLPWVAMAACA